jgi:hypothetical protein
MFSRRLLRLVYSRGLNLDLHTGTSLFDGFEITVDLPKMDGSDAES